MRSSRVVLFGTILSFFVAADSLAAPKNRPAPEPFVPAIAYTYIGSNYRDIRLSNAAGTAAMLVHRSNGIGSGIDLSPESAHLIAWEENIGSTGYLKVRSWNRDSSTGAVTIGPEQVLFQAARIHELDFSPDGSRIAFNWYDGQRYHLSVVEVASPQNVVTVVQDAPGALHIRWSPDGQYIYFVTVSGTTGQYIMHRVPAVANSSIETMFTLANHLGGFDALRPTVSPAQLGFVLSVKLPGWTSHRLHLWDGVSTDQGGNPALGARYPDGFQGHYNCQNNELLYRAAERREPLRFYNITTAATRTFSTDTNIRYTDWMPCG